MKTNGQVLWHNVTKIYHHNLEISPKMLHLCFSIYSHIVIYMWTCLRVEQPHHWAHCKHNYYSYYSLPGNRNHKDRTVLHGDLHAKQQFMHLPDLEIKTVEDADVCEGSALVPLAEIRNALLHTNLTKFSKISINSYKNKWGGGGVIHSFIDWFPARHAVCREAAFNWSELPVCVLFHLKCSWALQSAQPADPACTADAKGATFAVSSVYAGMWWIPSWPSCCSSLLGITQFSTIFPFISAAGLNEVSECCFHPQNAPVWGKLTLVCEENLGWLAEHRFLWSDKAKRWDPGFVTRFCHRLFAMLYAKKR